MFWKQWGFWVFSMEKERKRTICRRRKEEEDRNEREEKRGMFMKMNQG